MHYLATWIPLALLIVCLIALVVILVKFRRLEREFLISLDKDVFISLLKKEEFVLDTMTIAKIRGLDFKLQERKIKRMNKIFYDEFKYFPRL